MEVKYTKVGWYQVFSFGVFKSHAEAERCLTSLAARPDTENAWIEE